jgi:hypothetical protein
MKRVCAKYLFVFLVGVALSIQSGVTQEASSGLDLRATLTGQVAASNVLAVAPRSGVPAVAGFRSIVYPSWKIGNSWFVSGAWQLSTRPFYYQDFSSSGYGTKGNFLQAGVNYARVSNQGSVVVRVGEMPTAFGAFPLHYDDSDNPLVDLPIEYGYYDSPVSIFAVTGAQIDLSRNSWDCRVQFANSSPANPHGPIAQDQHGNWAAGAGYTIRQGFRVGLSGYRGPYLDRDGEDSATVRLSKFPASAGGIDVTWARGHTNIQGELQRFVMPHPAESSIKETAAYGEVKQVLSPRWYVATRVGVTGSRTEGNAQSIEMAAGIRPNRLQLLKFSFETEHYNTGDQQFENTFAVQLVTSLHRSYGRE